MERYSRKKTDIRYASPDGIRPNQDLIRRTRTNFNRKNIPTPRPIPIPIPIPPSPSQLPMPSQRLLTRKKSCSKSLSPVVIQGKNRKWTLKEKRSSKSKNTPTTRRRARGRKRSSQT